MIMNPGCGRQLVVGEGRGSGGRWRVALQPRHHQQPKFEDLQLRMSAHK